MTSPQFGQSPRMMNDYLGSGGQFRGINPLYQIGGPRSIQLALKLFDRLRDHPRSEDHHVSIALLREKLARIEFSVAATPS
jgi:hypothetical protein